MRKQILVAWVLAVLAGHVHAGNAGTANEALDNNYLANSQDALTFLAAATSDSHITQGALQSSAVSTNRPVWEGTVALGFTATAGNSDSVLVTGNVRAHRKALRDEWTLGADAAYGETSSVKNNESLHGFAQFNRLVGPRWYGYARADALHDGIADVVYRITFSPGAGYYFIKTAPTSLAGEVGPAVIYEKLDDEYHTFPTLRLAERFEHKFDAHARLWQTVEFLPPVNSPRDFIVNAEIGVETPLTKKISLQTFVDDNYVNHPAFGRKRNDVKVVSALAFKF
jgi:putative salt-induced outer membrane protein